MRISRHSKQAVVAFRLALGLLLDLPMTRLVRTIAAKRSARTYRGGRLKDWIKVKNRKHPAMERVMEAFSTKMAKRARSSG
jgi:hypothetical protein